MQTDPSLSPEENRMLPGTLGALFHLIKFTLRPVSI